MAIELFDFCTVLQVDSVTKSAFVQARQKIRPQFFEQLVDFTAKRFYRHFGAHTYNGLRLWSIDGTGLRIPDEPTLGDTFGWHNNQHNAVPSTRILCCYDLLNEIITKVVLHPRKLGEKTVTIPLVRHIPKDVLVIYDRGFGCYALPFLHDFYGSHCIIRLQKNFNPDVVNFIKSGKKQLTVKSLMSERGARTLRNLGFLVDRHTPIRYRLIRVDLPTGEVEVLLTNLMDRRKWPAKHFKALYAKRWGVETCFHVLKSYFQAALFSSYSFIGVSQDLWAIFALFNIQSACQRALKVKLKKLNRNRKWNYRLNRNVGLGYLKRFIAWLLIHPLKQLGKRLNRLLDLILSATEPVRPLKNRIRKRRHMRGTERHIFEFNYRHAL